MAQLRICLGVLAVTYFIDDVMPSWGSDIMGICAFLFWL